MIGFELFLVKKNFFFIKVLMLGLIVKLDISVRLTLQVITIICHHMKKVLLKKK